VLLVVVAIGWLAYFGSGIRTRAENRRSNSIQSFSKHLSALGGSAPIRSVSPGASIIPLRPGYLERPANSRMSLATARRRRRDVLAGMGGAVILSLALAVIVGTLGVLLLVVTSVLLASYLFLLVRAQRIGTERRTKVRYLPGARPVVADTAHVLLLRRSAN